VQPAPEPVAEEPAKPAPAPARRKKSLAVLETEQAEPQKRRRSARISGDKEQLDPRSLPPKSTKKPASKPATSVKKKKEITPGPEQPAEKSAFSGVRTPIQAGPSAKKRDGAATKIMLPFADTPVITRNKEMRKGGKDGHRRSSTGLRGRRASSLIDSGLSNGESKSMRRPSFA
jgi:kinetochore protein Mis13/DSN1